MVNGYEVLNYLLPKGGWVITGNDYEGIEFIEAKPITKEKFENTFAELEAKMNADAAAKEAARQALLDKLGITADEAALLGL
jgi:hypothetical protein